MKLKEFRIKNFRSYEKETSVELDTFVAFVGENDIGKSTVLEAMEIFFNPSSKLIKIDKDDVNKGLLEEGDTETVFTAVFSDLPPELILDSVHPTSLEGEYLLNKDGHLEITKKYSNAGKETVFIVAQHPANDECADLLLKTQAQLRKIISDAEIDCDNKNINAVMRQAIWSHHTSALQIEEKEIDVTKSDAKTIWEQLLKYLPVYSLFQSDRKNTDSDTEVQNPLSEAVKQILGNTEVANKLNEVAQTVTEAVAEVSESTLEKLKEMNPEIASELKPFIPDAASLNWLGVFKNIGINSDNDIPINKRGSGVKRLILLNFFRAQAERRQVDEDSPNIIYAIEEPETSQHTAHQKLLIDALLELAKTQNTQVFITTHSSQLVKKMSFENLRLIQNDSGVKSINPVNPHALPYPSLNEINFTSFYDATDEYHNELYGRIEELGLLNDFKIGKPTQNYKRLNRQGEEFTQQLILTEIIRHQIHHPENTLNERYTEEQLTESINLMRAFLLERDISCNEENS